MSHKTQGSYTMVFRAVDVVAMIEEERWRGRTTPVMLSRRRNGIELRADWTPSGRARKYSL